MTEKEYVYQTPKLPEWELYDYDKLEYEIEGWYEIIDFHSGELPTSYKFGRTGEYLIGYKKCPLNWRHGDILYRQMEFPLSVGMWFTDALEQKFWKPESAGGLRPWAGLVEHVDGEELGLGRGMAFGGPGIGGYMLCNHSRKGHPSPKDKPCAMFLQMHDFLLQDVGLYGFFSDLKDWYLKEQSTGIKKPLYPRVPNLGRLEVNQSGLVLPAGARLLGEFANMKHPRVKDAWIAIDDYLVIVSFSDDYFNQVEVPKASALWLAKTMDDLYIKGQGIDKLQGKVTRFFQTQIVQQEKIRLTNGLGQLPTGNTRFRLMNLSRSNYQDRLMAQEFDLFYGYYEKNNISRLLNDL